jgi:hypothetical protein
MSLFSNKEVDNVIENGAQDLSGFVEYICPKTIVVEDKASKIIDKVIEVMDQTKQVDFVSHGQFSLHQLIMRLCDAKFGKCHKILFTAWAIKPEPAQAIVSLKQKGLVDEIHCVLDYRVKSMEHESFELLKKNVDSFCLTNIHAKLVVLDYGSYKIRVITSANFTRNSRIETGYLSAEKRSCDMFYNLILKKIELWNLA